MKKLSIGLIAFLSFIFLPWGLFAQGWSELGTGANALNANFSIISVTSDIAGNVYAAQFSDSFAFNPLANNYITKWNGNNWTELGTGIHALNPNNYVISLTTDKLGNVYAAGDFTDSNYREYVAKWDGVNWTKLGTGVNSLNAWGQINIITTDKFGNVYAAGGFTDSGALPNGHPYVAKWDGVSWTELGTGPNALNPNKDIYSMAIDNFGNVYVAGGFTDSTTWLPNGNHYVAKWNGVGWTELGASLNALHADGAINSIAVDNIGNVYAEGQFMNSNGEYYVSKWDGSTWSELGINNNSLNPNSWTGTLTLDDSGYVYVTGDFTDSNGHYYVAKWNGNIWSKLGTGSNELNANGPVVCLTTDVLGNIYAGGSFTDSTGKYYVCEYSQYISIFCHNYSSGLGLDSTDIGRFIIGPDTFGSVYSHLANPAAFHSYTFNSADTIQLSVDSSYHIQEAGIMNTIHDADAKVTLFIDYNANGHYDIPEERVWTSYSKAFYYYILDTNIIIPSTVAVDTPLGMRLIINNDTGASAASDSACGTYVSGETQDYVVIFRNGMEGIRTSPGLSKGEVTVWPNPAENNLSIKIVGQATTNLNAVKIFDLVGREVYSNAVKGNALNINVSAWSNGMYICRVSCAGGEMVRKFVVNH